MATVIPAFPRIWPTQVEVKTSFEDFTEFLKEDSRAESLDIGNIRLAYNGYMEKVLETQYLNIRMMSREK